MNILALVSSVLVCVCMCVWVGADGLNWELSSVPWRRASLSSSLFIHQSIVTSEFAVQTQQLISDLQIYC